MVMNFCIETNATNFQKLDNQNNAKKTTRIAS